MTTNPANQTQAAAGLPTDGDDYVADLPRRKREFENYLSTKQAEISEQQEARRFYHGDQYTAEELRVYKGRKQPPVTYNREARKINAIVGLLDKQKLDPRAYPRTPNQEEGAEIATAVLRYVCDEQRWSFKSPQAGLNGAVDAIGGVELTIEQGDTQDPNDHDIGLERVDPATFFYDPMSVEDDFSDAQYMGTSKFVPLAYLYKSFPGKKAEIRNSIGSGSEFTSNPDNERRWIAGDKESRRVRLVDHWFIDEESGEWEWCLYTGAVELASGPSPFTDEKGNPICKYLMFSANVDHDGDRYGFHRGMRDPQREINMRRSKGLHGINSRRMKIVDGGGVDVETVRKEAARPDGVIVVPPGAQVDFDDAARGQELQGQLGFLEDAKNEIENFGFNPALIGQGVDQMSGIAIRQQQQAGIAELGPFMLSYRGWKLRVYRAIWQAVKKHWTAQRWIRVTDDVQVAQLFAVNQQQGIDPLTGAPIVLNALGALDVDIIVDEGPDVINMQQDAYDTLSIMAQKGQQVPPEVLIELSPLQGSIKQKILGMLQQAKQAAAQPNPLQLQGAQAEVADKEAGARLKDAQAQKALAEAGNAGHNSPEGQTPLNVLDFAKAAADIGKTTAETDHTRAKTTLDFANARKAVVDTHVNAALAHHQMTLPLKDPAAE